MIGSTLVLQLRHRQAGQRLYRRSRQRVVRYMSLGLLLSAGMNLMMGMTTNALLLAIFWGSTVGRSRWASALRGLAGALVRR